MPTCGKSGRDALDRAPSRDVPYAIVQNLKVPFLTFGFCLLGAQT